MNRFGMWFRNYMQGRYGTDDFNRFLVVVTLVLIVIDLFVNVRVLDFAIVALLIYTYCRMFSRNINARYRENMKFLQFKAKFPLGKGRRQGRRGNAAYGSDPFGHVSPEKGGTGSGRGFGVHSKASNGTVYRIFICPSCGGKFRVPQGVGRVTVKCPHCGRQSTETI